MYFNTNRMLRKINDTKFYRTVLIQTKWVFLGFFLEFYLDELGMSVPSFKSSGDCKAADS